MADAAHKDDPKAKMLEQRFKALQLEQQKRNAVKRYLSDSAYERLMNVRVSNYELYNQLVDLLLSLAQAKRLQTQLSEDQLRDILSKMTYKPESKIEFKHK